jgi:hypothetical protein
MMGFYRYFLWDTSNYRLHLDRNEQENARLCGFAKQNSFKQ